jgi:hypothetical protein
MATTITAMKTID